MRSLIYVLEGLDFVVGDADGLHLIHDHVPDGLGQRVI
jgi:hypothetical protein